MYQPKLLLFNCTANGFLPGGSGTTINDGRAEEFGKIKTEITEEEKKTLVPKPLRL
jgi:hypothetical protein